MSIESWKLNVCLLKLRPKALFAFPITREYNGKAKWPWAATETTSTLNMLNFPHPDTWEKIVLLTSYLIYGSFLYIDCIKDLTVLVVSLTFNSWALYPALHQRSYKLFVTIKSCLKIFRNITKIYSFPQHISRFFVGILYCLLLAKIKYNFWVCQVRKKSEKP